MKKFKQDHEEMKTMLSKLEHDAQLLTMIFHYGKAAYDRGHHWVNVKKVELHDYQHYWVRRFFTDQKNHRWKPVLCEWTKNGWVDMGVGYLNSTTAVNSTIEVWEH